MGAFVGGVTERHDQPVGWRVEFGAEHMVSDVYPGWKQGSERCGFGRKKTRNRVIVYLNWGRLACCGDCVLFE